MQIKLNDTHILSRTERVDWVVFTAAQLRNKWGDKYINGIKAHHDKDLGNLTVLDLLDELEAEALDTLSYVRELKRRIVHENVVVNK